MKRILSFVLIAVIAAFSGVAYGATTTTTLNVSATAVPTCTVSTTPVNFGDFDGTVVYANGDVTVTCVSGTAYNIALDAGQGYDGSYRRLGDGWGNYIQYRLDKDASHIFEWSDSDFANTYPWGSSLADTGNGSAQPHTVYGYLWPGSVPSGTYTDVVTVTVHY